MPGPTVSGVPPGADFVQCLRDCLLKHAAGQPPEYLARMTVLVPSRRMQRRLKSLFEASGNLLLPRIGLVSDVSHLVPGGRQLSPVSPLKRMLDLKGVVAKLVELDGRLSQSDVIDLTSSLTALLDEMHGEGVSFDSLEQISPDDQSGHWAQSLSFLKAIRDYAEALDAERVDPEAVHRAEVEALITYWTAAPPDHPVILAGSTGSRATTRLLMTAVASLPKGEVILPGFDFDLPDHIWAFLTEDQGLEDHPQFRFATFLQEIGLPPSSVAKRGDAPEPIRNCLISLSLRPAPVTDVWLKEGPELGDLEVATASLSLIDARDPKEEAAAIALAMRAALGQGRSVALIAPDATLARRVTAGLVQWGLKPDDSGGMPLSLSPLGRFLRHTVRIGMGEIDPVDLMALLKHPLSHAGVERGAYMRTVQEFELFLRKKKFPNVDLETLKSFAASREADAAWVDWLAAALELASSRPESTFSAAFAHHQSVTDAFVGEGRDAAKSPNDAEQRISDLMERFRSESSNSVDLEYMEYVQLLERAFSSESAREQDGVRPDLMIWGPLEARVQGAEVVILGGLNEGTWPSEPTADPWLNRSMRRAAGLLLPERQIGLAAHDYQQAIAAKDVILTRASRSEGSETVPSRWLGRLTNLLDGLATNGGERALQKMRERGNAYLRVVSDMDQTVAKPVPAKRPAPSPPVATRPRKIAVTDIQRLIRDPYAVYARRILRLQPLDPLTPEIDARHRGIVFHRILEKFFDPAAAFIDPDAERNRLTEIASNVLENDVFDPTARVEWLAQFRSNADWLISGEMHRRESAFPIAQEVKGSFAVPSSTFTLVGKADRIDRQNDGTLIIYDYKTGKPPSAKDILRYDRQLFLEAVMAEAGAFENVALETVAHVVHLGVGRTPETRTTQLVDENDTVTVSGKIAELLNATLEPSFGFVSCRAVENLRFEGDYDHLARFGEWDTSQSAEPDPLT